MFDFPKYSQLDKNEQDPVVNFPLDKPIMVYGPPGSGKTVLAIYRTSNLHEKFKGEDKNRIGYIVYNNTLNDYIEKVIEANKDKINLTYENLTFHSWLTQFYRKHSGGQMPPCIKEFIYKWDEIILLITEKAVSGSMDERDYYHLIIDEGQDLPVDFYKMLIQITDSFSIFVDENQRISETQSTMPDIRNTLTRHVLPDKNVFKLTKNFRNTKQIALVSKCFYTGMPSGIPEIPERKGPKPLCFTQTKNEQFTSILKYCEGNSGSIGIFVPDISVLRELYRYLSKSEKVKPRLEFYHERKKIDCPKCHDNEIRVVDGKYGKFLSCKGYPACKYEQNCPACKNGKMKLKTNGYNKSVYWECDNVKCKTTFNENSGFRGLPRLKFTKNSIFLLHYQSAKGLEFQHVLLPFLSSSDKYAANTPENKMKFYVLTSRAREILRFYKYPNQRIDILDNVPFSENLIDYK